MSHISSPIALLIDVLADVSDSEIVIQSQDDNALCVLLNLKRVDGKVVPYNLLLKGTKNHQVEVSEYTPNHLPAFCPERHINYDGTFCLYWEGDINLNVTDIGKATLWWQTLIGFLLKQERANKKRQWPDRNVWAHGSAAKFQQQAQLAIEKIGNNLKDDVLNDYIYVNYNESRKGNGSYYQVFKNNILWYVVWERFQRVVGLRQRCLCNPPNKIRQKRYKVSLRNCTGRTHHQQFAKFAIAFYHWKNEEEKFLMCFKGKTCCGTLNQCPLK